MNPTQAPLPEATDTTIHRAYASFAGPFMGDATVRARLLDVIQHGHVIAKLAWFVETFSQQFGAASSGLAETLSRCTHREPRFEWLWSTAMTGIGACQPGGTVDPVRAGAELALDLGRKGLVGSWSARFSTPTAIRFGPYILPPATEVDVEHRLGRVAIRLHTSDGASTELTTESAPHDDRVTVLPAVGDGHYQILSATNLPLGCQLASDVAAEVTETVAPVFIERLTAAVDALDVVGSAYSGWVQRVICEVIALRSESGRMRSGSNTAWPGVVYLTAADPFVMAENLVHEASHQYFHLLTRIEPAVATDHTKQYYSPFVDRARPLRAIALAFHAFGNARIFLEMGSAQIEVRREWLRGRMAELDNKLAVVDRHLSGNSALTPLGRALVTPVRHALTELCGTCVAGGPADLP